MRLGLVLGAQAVRYTPGAAVLAGLTGGLAYAGLLDAVAVSSVGEGVAIGLLIGLLHSAAAMVAAGWVFAHVHGPVRNGQLA